MENARLTLPIVSVSEMRAFRRCHREHYYSYELGYRAIARTLALAVGTVGHKGLEVWWHTHDLDRAILAAQLEASSAEAKLDEYELVKVEELLRGYHFRWGDDTIQTVAVEQEFQAPLRNPRTGAQSKTYDLGGKLDVLAFQPPGHPERATGNYIVEHKFVSEDIGLGSVYWQCLKIDSQVSTYFVGAESLGYPVVGCLYDLIRKPQIRPSQVPLVDAEGVKIVHDASGVRVRTKDGKKWRETGDNDKGYVLQTRPETAEEFRARLRADIAEDPDKFYQRGTVVRIADEMRDAELDIWQTARLIREAELEKRHPRNPEACRRYSRMCEFWDVCVGAASLTDETRFRKREEKHEELRGTANGVAQPVQTSAQIPF
jgi:hypothetical protein